MTTGSDPFGELTEEEYAALSPADKGKRTKAYNDQQEAQAASQGDADDDSSDPLDRVQIGDGDDDDDTDPDGEDWEEEEPVQLAAAEVEWTTAGADGKPIQ